MVATIQSIGDLEVLVLHEAHEALSEIISPQMYAVLGTPPDQQAQFHNEITFKLFLVLIIEFFAEGVRNVSIDGNIENLSLIAGIQRVCEMHPDEANASGLDSAVAGLQSWIIREVPFRFWCADLQKDIRVSLTNARLISYGANATKHHLLRISDLLEKLDNLCQSHGYQFTPHELVAVMNAMIEEVSSRLIYHSSCIIEMLGKVFLAVNAVIKARYESNPTNRANELHYPAGITSDVFRDLYSSMLVFRNYDDARIRSCIPVTSRFLKLRYLGPDPSSR